MKKVIQKYKVFEYLAVFQEENEGGFSVWIPELPGCASQGENFEEALRNIKEATGLYLETLDIKSLDLPDYKKQFAVPITLSHA